MFLLANNPKYSSGNLQHFHTYTLTTTTKVHSLYLSDDLHDYLNLSCVQTEFRWTGSIQNEVLEWKAVLLQACDWLWLLQESQLLPNQVLSEQQSSLVIRKLLAIAMSGITYLRGVFPEKAYGTKYVEGYVTRQLL